MIKVIAVIVKVGKRNAIIRNNSLAAMQLRRAMVADDIQYYLNIPFMQGLDHSAHGDTVLQRGRFTLTYKMGINALEVLGPVAVHGPMAILNVIDLLKQRREPDCCYAKLFEVVGLLYDALEIATPVMPPMGKTRIMEFLLADPVIGSVAIKEAIDHNKINCLLSKFRLLFEQLVC